MSSSLASTSGLNEAPQNINTPLSAETASPVNINNNFTEAQFKQAMKRLARLEKQNSHLIDELVKAKQCINQLRIEKQYTHTPNVILDKFSDNLVSLYSEDEEDEDMDGDDDDEEEEVGGTLDQQVNKKKELIDQLLEDAEADESFARVLQDLSGYQPISEPPKSSSKSSSNVSATSSAQTTSGAAGASKKRNRPVSVVTSGSRFNRLSPLTQAMRTGIISDDEGAGNNNTSSNSHFEEDHNTQMTDNDEDADNDPELAQLKKVRRSQGTGSGVQSLEATPIKSTTDEQVFKVIPVPFDSEGKPVLPLSLNMITVHHLGEIIYDHPAYHSKRYILPVGFTTSRSYLSCIDPDGTMTYFSTILNNGPHPLYQVSPEGHPEIVFQSASTTGAWAAVAKACSSLRGKESVPSVSGPDYFGLSNPTVSMLIEKLPDSERCEMYQPKKYEVSNLVGGKSAKKTQVEEQAANSTANSFHESESIDILNNSTSHPDNHESINNNN